jgi:hypothetical protein
MFDRAKILASRLTGARIVLGRTDCSTVVVEKGVVYEDLDLDPGNPNPVGAKPANPLAFMLDDSDLDF